jgi:hypothetical protein
MSSSQILNLVGVGPKVSKQIFRYNQNNMNFDDYYCLHIFKFLHNHCQVEFVSKMSPGSMVCGATRCD